MNVHDLRNLLILARKGISVLSETLSSEQAEAAWKSITAGETSLKIALEKVEELKSTPIENTDVEVVKFKE